LTRKSQAHKATENCGPSLPSLCPLCLCGGTSYGNHLGSTNLTTEIQRTQSSRAAKPERGRSPSAARAKWRAPRIFRQSSRLLAAADGDRPRSEKSSQPESSLDDCITERVNNSRVNNSDGSTMSSLRVLCVGFNRWKEGSQTSDTSRMRPSKAGAFARLLLFDAARVNQGLLSQWPREPPPL